jgi:hypothetical protein
MQGKQQHDSLRQPVDSGHMHSINCDRFRREKSIKKFLTSASIRRHTPPVIIRIPILVRITKYFSGSAEY